MITNKDISIITTYSNRLWNNHFFYCLELNFLEKSYYANRKLVVKLHQLSLPTIITYMDISWLTKIDKGLFYIINNQLSWQPIENTMLLMRQPLTWVPVYFFLLLFFYNNCRKYILPIILLSIITFSLTDFTSATLLKPLIHRIRPCYDLTLSFPVNNPAGCGGLFSMPSSHASNHFGLSAFWFLTIRHLLQRKWYLLWVWAFCIGYAQIFVGVHFPGDILAGAFLGISVGYCAFYFFKKWMSVFDNSSEINAPV